MTDEPINEIQECRIYESDWKDLYDYLNFLKHKKAYVRAGEMARGLRAMDFGCGSGYGTIILADEAAHVVGADASPRAIEFCSEHHAKPNLEFKKITPNQRLPFDDGAFDVISSFQVIEHVPDVPPYLAELKRVLKPGGKLLITTPNRKYRLLPGQKPWNPAHEREYSDRSLAQDLAATFADYTILGVYGTPEINAQITERLKQNPLGAYVYQPLKRVLRGATPGLADRLDRAKEKAVGSPEAATPKGPSEEELAQYSLDDFTVGGEVGLALDFFAVCVKE